MSGVGRRVIENSEGGRITPSVVLFDNDEITVGEQAVNALQYRPLDTVREVKRHMGERDWHYMSPEGKTLTPEEISAFILTRLKRDADSSSTPRSRRP